MEEIRGKLRGNLECGSAQPSLFWIKPSRLKIWKKAWFRKPQNRTIMFAPPLRSQTLVSFRALLTTSCTLNRLEIIWNVTFTIMYVTVMRQIRVHALLKLSPQHSNKNDKYQRYHNRVFHKVKSQNKLYSEFAQQSAILNNR